MKTPTISIRSVSDQRLHRDANRARASAFRCNWQLQEQKGNNTIIQGQRFLNFHDEEVQYQHISTISWKGILKRWRVMLPFISWQGGNKPQPACISTASISTSQMPAIEDFGWLWCSVNCIPKLLWWSFAVACYHTPIRSHAASWGGLKCGGWLWCAPRDLWREQHGHLATRSFFFSNQLRTWGTTVVGNDRVQPQSHLLHASTAVEAYTPTANSQVKNEAHTKPEQFSRWTSPEHMFWEQIQIPKCIGQHQHQVWYKSVPHPLGRLSWLGSPGSFVKIAPSPERSSSASSRARSSESNNLVPWGKTWLAWKMASVF